MVNIFDEMEKINPERNPVFTAIDRLKKPNDIRQFLKDYEAYLIANTNESISGREGEVARSNIGYVLGYYDEPVRKKWYSILDDVSHPIFGHSFGRV